MKILLIIISVIIFSNLSAQLIQNENNTILDKIHLQSQRQAQMRKSLGDYKHKQFIHFIKYDSDGEIDEQSKREYYQYIKSDSLRKRELISALEYEDGKWNDITEKQKNKRVKSEHHSKSFSLSEMFGPENRRAYNFEITGEENIGLIETIHLTADPIEPDEDKFQGDLWFDTAEYNLVKASLKPSDMPTFVDNMSMMFNMQKIDSLWFPDKIVFEADVSVLFFFSGKVHSEILFSDFEFNQYFDEEWFNNLESAD